MNYKAPTPSPPNPHPLSEGIDGVRRLIAACRNEKQRALVALCGLCGARVSEALSVTPSNFDLHRMKLTIRGKGDKSRIVPISPEAWEVMQPAVTRAFIHGHNVVPMADRLARRTVKNLGKRAQLRREISSHDLRATFATAVLDKSGNPRLVQVLLGHESLETTQAYLGIDEDKLKNAVEL